MRTKQALVLAVERPKVAHNDMWAVTVLVPRHWNGKVYREKRVVFTSDRPAIHTWITVSLM
jgi:hypothetical protein